MRVLLDENLPRQLIRDLAGHEVASVRELGWSGTQNGALLRRAEGQYDVLLTADRNLQHQQNLAAFKISVIVMAPHRNTLILLRPLVPQVMAALETIQMGDVVVIRP